MRMLVFVVLLLCACQPQIAATSTVEPTQTLNAASSLTPTAMPTQTASPTATATRTPTRPPTQPIATFTQPSPTATDTPTNNPTITAAAYQDCWFYEYGLGVRQVPIYDVPNGSTVIGTVNEWTEALRVLEVGQWTTDNSSAEWILVLLPDGNNTGWFSNTPFAGYLDGSDCPNS